MKFLRFGVLVPCLAPSLASAQVLRRASNIVQTGSSDGTVARTTAPPSHPPPAGAWTPRQGWNPCALPFPYAFGGRYPYRVGLAPFVAHPMAASGPITVRGAISLEGGWTLPTVGRWGASARLDFGDFELSTRYSGYLEAVDGGIETVALGRWDVGIRIADLTSVDVRLRGGATHWVDAQGHRAGLSGGVAVDAFPASPWVISAELGGGSVGRAGMVYARATVGWMVGRVELALGWDHVTLIATDNSPSVDLTGPTFAVRLWL